MDNNLLAIATNESGLKQETAKFIEDQFTDFLKDVKIWESKANDFVITDVSQVKEMKEAKKARLALKNIRVSADKKRKELKAESLRYGKTVQSVYNIIEGLISPIETKLLEQEKFAENKEADRIAKIKEEREIELEPFAEFVPIGLDFGTMTAESFELTLNGAKLQLQAKRDKEAKEEAERVELIRIEEEKREAIRLENEKLKAEKIEADRLSEVEREKQAEILAEQKRLADIKLKEQQEKANKEAKRLADIAEQEQIKKDAETKRKMKILADRAKELSPYIYLIADYNKTLKLSIPEYNKDLKSLKLAHKIEQEQKQKEIKANILKVQKAEAEKQRLADLETEKLRKKHWSDNKAVTVDFSCFSPEEFEALEHIAEENSNDLNLQLQDFALEYMRENNCI